MKKTKTYDCSVECEIRYFTIRAKSKTEARQKLKSKLEKKSVWSFREKDRIYIEEL